MIEYNYGREGLINLLRQFDNFHKDKKTISVGFIGYPNVGKSSIINSLKKKVVCKAAPIPGETKVWQYVNLTNRIYLIDCPGVVYRNENDTDVDIVLKGVVRPEKLTDPDLTVSSAIEKKYATALALSNNGTLNMNHNTDLSSYSYKVRTTSGTPYQVYSSQSQPLTLELDINGRIVQLPATFNTVGAAKQQIEETINLLETEMTSQVFKEEYQKALKESGNTEEAKQLALKKLNEMSKSELPLKIKERIEQMYQTGTIFDVFGLQNPQLTRTQQQLQDLINGN